MKSEFKGTKGWIFHPGFLEFVKFEEEYESTGPLGHAGPHKERPVLSGEGCSGAFSQQSEIVRETSDGSLGDRFEICIILLRAELLKERLTILSDVS